MKRGKDDEKIMGPMFPRLHVNDTEKGGPRAPPRNKMALYEQLSTPSHRLNHGYFPVNTSKASNFVPSASSSQGIGIERNLLFPHYVPSSTPTHSHLAEKLQPRQTDDGNSSASSSQLEQRKKVGDEDDFTVPVFVHSSMGKTQNGSDRERPIPFDPNPLSRSTKIQNADDSDKKNTSSRGTNSRQGIKNQSEEHLELLVSSKDLSVRSSKSFSTRGNIARPGAVSLSQQSDLPNTRLCKNNVCLQNDSVHNEDVPELAREIQKRNTPGPITVSGSYSGDNLNSRGEPEIDSELQDETCRSLQFGNGDRSDDISETSMVDSISALDITPDEVVGVIGHKRFLEARNAIVNQQRLFAVQVFELHRLIKVQRLIAASPHLLVESGTYVAQPSPKISLAKQVPSDYVVMPPVHVAKCKDDNDKPNHKRERSAENAMGKTSFSSVKNGSQPSSYGPYLGNPTPVPLPSDGNMGPWCFHPSLGNQWLVPVMSPSEGLVYKPYAARGLAGSVCGGCGPFGTVPLNGNFMNPCYGVPPSYNPYGTGVVPGFPPVGHGYFPPYAMTAPVSGSAVEQMNYIAGSGSEGHTGQLSGVGANFNMQHQSSCNVPTQKRGPVSQVAKPQAARDRELPGSTESSPSERVQGLRTLEAAEGRDALQLFPMAPATPEGAVQYLEVGHPTRVIKVVPHNARSATESAARIFQSIQEERKHYDSI